MPEDYTRARNVRQADEVMKYKLTQTDNMPREFGYSDWEALFSTMKKNRNNSKMKIVEIKSADTNSISFNRYEQIFE